MQTLERETVGHLTPRENQVVILLTRGLVTKEIAQELNVSFDTVRFHLKHLYLKLDVHSRTEAIRKYLAYHAHRQTAHLSS